MVHVRSLWFGNLFRSNKPNYFIYRRKNVISICFHFSTNHDENIIKSVFLEMCISVCWIEMINCSYLTDPREIKWDKKKSIKCESMILLSYYRTCWWSSIITILYKIHEPLHTNIFSRFGSKFLSSSSYIKKCNFCQIIIHIIIIHIIFVYECESQWISF